MKYIGILIFLVIKLFLYGQSNKNSPQNELNLNKELIRKIEISNYCGPMDSCLVIIYKLSTSMAEGLLERLIKSDTAEPCEFDNLCWLKVYLTDSTIRTYITNGFLYNEVKESDDYPLYTNIIKADDLCLRIKNLDYLSHLWKELDLERIK